MPYFIVVLLAAGILIAVGIYRQKTIFSQPHYTEAKVVGFQAERGFTSVEGLAKMAMGIGCPVVQIVTENGMVTQVKLHTEISKAQFEMYPELDYGGCVDVMYYGDNPKEVYLVDHPLGSKPVGFSMLILVGIGLIVVFGGMIALAFYLIN